MSGKPIFVDIHNNNTYCGPQSILDGMRFMANEKHKTTHNQEKWQRYKNGIDVFFHHSEDWWVLRRTGNQGVVPSEETNDRSIEIP